jgi:superfamily II DNA or RNA helicase
MVLVTALFNDTTIIYVIGLDLLYQFHKLFSTIFDEKIGFIGNGICDIQRINIVSIWTIGRALDVKNVFDKDSEIAENETDINNNQKHQIIKLLMNTKIHCFDESHVITTSTATKIYEVINFSRIYGFSGTPFRDDNSDLLINGILGEQIINVSANELIEKQILVQPIIKFIPVPPLMFSSFSNYQGCYKEYIVENDVRNNLIIKYTKDLLDKNYTLLVLFKQIKHGEKLYSLMIKNGINCELLSGGSSSEEREQTKNRLLKKEIRVILASTIFDLGVDLPIINGLILCGGGKSSIRTLQRIGRVIRGSPGKKFAAVIDFFDQVKFLKKHSKLRYKIYCLEKGFKVFGCKGL